MFLVFFVLLTTYSTHCSVQDVNLFSALLPNQNLPTEVNNFVNLIKGKTFIDKTKFIKEVLEEVGMIVIITRPARFGKTTNLSMLNAFISQNLASLSKLFDGLDILKYPEFCEQHQNKYPVIYVSFSSIDAVSYASAQLLFKSLVAALFMKHTYVLQGNTMSPEEKNLFILIVKRKLPPLITALGIARLSAWVSRRFGKKVIIILDDFDAPMQVAFRYGYHIRMSDLMKVILKKSLDLNKNLEKAIVTGIMPINEVNLTASVHTVLDDKYDSYFGFTESDLKKVMSQVGTNLNLKDLKTWYEGYFFGKQMVYNPVSIKKCLERGTFTQEGIRTPKPEMIQKLLGESEKILSLPYYQDLLQKKELKKLLSNRLLYDEIASNETMFWAYFVHTGFLRAKKNASLEMNSNEWYLSVPNEEVRLLLSNFVKDWFKDSLIGKNHVEYAECILSGKALDLKKYVSDYLQVLNSTRLLPKKSSKAIFYTLVLGSLSTLMNEYDLVSDKEGHKGEASALILPKARGKRGIIIEFKAAEREVDLKEEADLALTRVEEATLKEFRNSGIKSFLAVGMSFLGTSVEIICKDENFYASSSTT